MLLDSVIPSIMKISRLIPGDKQLPVMSAHTVVPHHCKVVVFYRGFSVQEKTALGNRRAKLPDYPYTYRPYSMKQHALRGSTGWVFFSTGQQLFCANTATFRFTALGWKYSEWRYSSKRGS